MLTALEDSVLFLPQNVPSGSSRFSRRTVDGTKSGKRTAPDLRVVLGRKKIASPFDQAEIVDQKGHSIAAGRPCPSSQRNRRLDDLKR